MTQTTLSRAPKIGEITRRVETSARIKRELYDAAEVSRRITAGEVSRCPARYGIAPLRIAVRVVEQTIPAHWCASEEAMWFVVSTAPAKEYMIANYLERQGWATWLPECVVERKHKRQHGHTVQHRGPLFPGYIFVRFDLNLAQWRIIEEADGVDCVLRYIDRPHALDREEVDRLRMLCDADGGAIIIKAGMPRRQFCAGEQVRVTSGAFQGFEAVIDSVEAKDRINILLDILGATRVIAVPEAQVEPA